MKTPDSKYRKKMNKVLSLLREKGPMTSTQINDLLRLKDKRGRANTIYVLIRLWTVDGTVRCKTAGKGKLWWAVEVAHVQAT